MQTEFAGKPDEPGKIQPSGEIEFAFPDFVQMPCQICFHGVEAAAPEFEQTVFPLFGKGAEIVNCAGKNGVWLPVQQNLMLFYGKFHAGKSFSGYNVSFGIIL